MSRRERAACVEWRIDSSQPRVGPKINGRRARGCTPHRIWASVLLSVSAIEGVMMCCGNYRYRRCRGAEASCAVACSTLGSSPEPCAFADRARFPPPPYHLGQPSPFVFFPRPSVCPRLSPSVPQVDPIRPQAERSPWRRSFHLSLRRRPLLARRVVPHLRGVIGSLGADLLVTVRPRAVPECSWRC